MRIRKLFAAVLVLCFMAMNVSGLETAALAANMPYRILVDISSQIVTIYDNETNEIVRQMLCTTGAKDATPTGTFVMPVKKRPEERTPWFHFNAFGGYARYASRIVWDVMFHSLLYNHPNVYSLAKSSVEEYGRPASHGCIRMRWQDAEFIAKNCLPGTVVKIYKSGSKDDELRELLFQASYTNENGQTYKQFLGVPDEEGVLGNFSEGDEVKDLQLRLKDLGIFTEEVTGVYRAATVNAVRQAQAMMGMEETGVATREFQQAIFSADAPSAMNGTLQEGKSGPAVRKLQENLAGLRIYEGDVDSAYDVDVVDAVKTFQSAYGYEADGIATSEIQKAIYYEAGKLKAMFSMDDGYSFQKIDEKIYMGKINCELGVRLRKSASIDSEPITVLHENDVIVARERGDQWCLVQKGKYSGYIKTQYIDFYPQDISSLKYTSTSGNTEYTIGYTAEDYFSGVDRPADVFSEYLASGGSLDDYEGLATFASVKTDSPEITLNLREQPNTECTILAALTNGTQMKVKQRSDDWSLVEYDGMTGYLMSDYLEFWTGPETALQDAAVETDEDAVFGEYDETVEGNMDTIEHAQVSCDTADKAQVYDENSADATVLGTLKNGIRVDVLQTMDGWSLISYEGHQGYMREMDLQFINEGVLT